MNTNTIMEEGIISLNLEKRTNEEVIEHLFRLLKDQGYVKESFLKAVVDREKNYPTGLPLASMGVAIPHTDPEHVNQPAIAVATLHTPVEFHMMGADHVPVDIHIVFMLAIKEPGDQISLLEKLMNIFQNEDIMGNLKNAKTSKEIKELLESQLN